MGLWTWSKSLRKNTYFLMTRTSHSLELIILTFLRWAKMRSSSSLHFSRNSLSISIKNGKGKGWARSPCSKLLGNLRFLKKSSQLKGPPRNHRISVNGSWTRHYWSTKRILRKAQMLIMPVFTQTTRSSSLDLTGLKQIFSIKSWHFRDSRIPVLQIWRSIKLCQIYTIWGKPRATINGHIF